MPDSYVIDTSRPIDGVSSHTELDSAETAARRVSRNGGSAQITLRDNATGVETQIKGYTPYEVAVEDLIQSAGEAA
ncbi:hypothetical protein HZU38_30795 (plasmid) [Mycolicibacterium vanbaalenii]|nr:hypothetical protein HZU38_30795 [Mycolicibacterium vanbaalenii]